MPLLFAFLVLLPGFLPLTKHWTADLGESMRERAYADYFHGIGHFLEGEISLSNQYFQSAHRAIPTHFSFCLAYSLSLGRLNRWPEALVKLEATARLIKANGPDRDERQAQLAFVRGMVSLYNYRYEEARASLEQARQLFVRRGDRTMESQALNALGYLLVLDQGMNLDKASQRGLHGHVYPISLFRAASLFRRALLADATNLHAQQNFGRLNDSLCLDISAPMADRPNRREELNLSSWQSGWTHKFGIEPGEEVVFLVDISGSMLTEKVSCTGLDRFRSARWLVGHLLEGLGEGHPLGLGSVGGDCQMLPAVWEPAGSLTPWGLSASLSRLMPEGSTPLSGMLSKAAELFPLSGERAGTLFVISDGANTCPGPRQELADAAASLLEKRVRVHVLSFLQNTVAHAGAFADYEVLTEGTGGSLMFLENNGCQMANLSEGLFLACGLALPPFVRSPCLGTSIPNLWMYFRSDLIYVDKAKRK